MGSEYAYPRYRTYNPHVVALADVQAFGEYLHDLTKQRGGRLLPEELVEASRPEDAVMHKVFEWNDAKAAHTHRVRQARQAIQAIGVDVRPSVHSEEVVSVRAFAASAPPAPDPTVPDDRKAYYAIAKVLGTPELREAYLKDILRRLNALRKQYEDQAVELREVWDSIREATVRLGR